MVTVVTRDTVVPKKRALLEKLKISGAKAAPFLRPEEKKTFSSEGLDTATLEGRTPPPITPPQGVQAPEIPIVETPEEEPTAPQERINGLLVSRHESGPLKGKLHGVQLPNGPLLQGLSHGEILEQIERATSIGRQPSLEFQAEERAFEEGRIRDELERQISATLGILPEEVKQVMIKLDKSSAFKRGLTEAISIGVQAGTTGAATGATVGLFGGPVAPVTSTAGAFIVGTIATVGGAAFGFFKGFTAEFESELAGEIGAGTVRLRKIEGQMITLISEVNANPNNAAVAAKNVQLMNEGFWLIRDEYSRLKLLTQDNVGEYLKLGSAGTKEMIKHDTFERFTKKAIIIRMDNAINNPNPLLINTGEQPTTQPPEL